MNVEALGTTPATPPRINEPTQQVERKRTESQQQPQVAVQDNAIQPEELLSQIKSITEDGLYSVRFERDSGSNELIVKIVDSDTEEVIRQIPPEELINLSKHLRELAGNIINTVS